MEKLIILYTLVLGLFCQTNLYAKEASTDNMRINKNAKSYNFKVSDVDGFKVDGTKLLDRCGNEFVMRGVNLAYTWFKSSAYTQLEAINKYEANAVRIVLGDGAKFTADDAASVRKIIDKCKEYGIVAIVEVHDATGSDDINDLVKAANYFADMASVLKGTEHYVIINIANEWGSHKVATHHWLKSYTEAVAMMREVGYKTTLVVDAPGWGQNIKPILKRGRELIENDPLHNILFSIHMYGSWNNPKEITEKLEAAKKENLPLIVGEFGYNYDNGHNNLHCKADHRLIMATCHRLGYGFMPWSWTGNNRENAWLDMVSSSDWKTPTWWGREVIDGEFGIRQAAQRAKVFDEK